MNPWLTFICNKDIFLCLRNCAAIFRLSSFRAKKSSEERFYFLSNFFQFEIRQPDFITNQNVFTETNQFAGELGVSCNIEAQNIRKFCVFLRNFSWFLITSFCLPDLAKLVFSLYEDIPAGGNSPEVWLSTMVTIPPATASITICFHANIRFIYEDSNVILEIHNTIQAFGEQVVKF